MTIFNKILIFGIGALVAVFFIGIAIPKLTVRDLVSVSPTFTRCVQQGIAIHHDNPIERVALLLGKSRIVHVTQTAADVEMFTLFRIPLGVLRKQPAMRTIVICGAKGEVGSIRTYNSAIGATSFPDSLSSPDNLFLRGVGQHQKSSVHEGVKRYESTFFGISFNYPSEYLLFEKKEGKEYSGITLIVDSPYLREAMAGVRHAMGSPPSISFSFYPEPNLTLSLEAWLRTNQRQSNFNPSDFAQDGILTPTTVGGIPALQYSYGGLFDPEVAAFIYKDWVVLVRNDLEDSWHIIFEDILSSLQIVALSKNQPESELNIQEVIDNIPSRSISESEMQGWKSHTSEKLGISFRYPPEYLVVERKAGSTDVSLRIFEDTPHNRHVEKILNPDFEYVIPEDQNNPDYEPWSQVISFSRSVEGNSTQDVVEWYKENKFGKNGNPHVYAPAQFIGTDSVIYLQESLFTLEGVVFEKDGHLYQFRVQYFTSPESPRDDFYKIISTVEFQ